jgi:hypothetical protein
VIIKRYNLEDEKFLRQLVFPEEDRHRFTSAPWRGEFRWFRAGNIVPIEYWCRRPTNSGVVSGRVASIKRDFLSKLTLTSEANSRRRGPEA